MSWGEPFILSSCSMDALLQRREQLRAQRAALADQNRQLSRRERRENQAQQRQWRLREDVRRVVLIVLVLAHGASAPLVPYLQGVGRRSHWPEKSEDEIDELALDLFLDADVDWVTELSDEGAPADPVAMRTALCIVSEWRVAVWTEAQNRQRGAAPSTSMVLAEFERHRAQFPEAVRPRRMGASADPAARKRVSRWRYRWGGRYGQIRAREVVPLPLLQAKAARLRRGELVGGVVKVVLPKRRSLAISPRAGIPRGKLTTKICSRA